MQIHVQRAAEGRQCAGGARTSDTQWQLEGGAPKSCVNVGVGQWDPRGGEQAQGGSGCEGTGLHTTQRPSQHGLREGLIGPGHTAAQTTLGVINHAGTLKGKVPSVANPC